MKLLLFFLVMLATWYLAAMYHLVSLLALAIAQFLLLLFMFAVSRYLKGHLKCGFKGETLVLPKQHRTPCPLVVKNTGRLPVGRYRLRLRLSYWDRPGETTAFLSGSAGSKEGAETDFYINAPRCGLLTISIDKVQAFDYLCLFKAEIAHAGELRIAVLPAGARMQLRLSSDFENHLGAGADIRPVLGSGGGEIRQLREYAAGDPYRLIHWNLTARMDEPWIKEQEQEREHVVFLYLHLCSDAQWSAQRLDAFFEVLYSLATCLVEQQLSVHVAWKEPSGASAGMMVDSVDTCRALLLWLYQSVSILQHAAGPSARGKTGLIRDLDLALYSNGREVFRFSPEHYRDELEQRVFVL